MSNTTQFEQLKNECQLKDADFYLLELIPLIEMIWADNKNQPPELNLLYKFTAEHIAKLTEAANGEEVITVAQANDFLDRFAHKQPSRETLTAIRQFVINHWHEQQDRQHKENTKQSILNYCLDIAASCVAAYPYGYHQRVSELEKQFLNELMKAFQINPKQIIET